MAGGMAVEQALSPIVRASPQPPTDASGLYLRPHYLPPGYRVIAQVFERMDNAGHGQIEYVTWHANPAVPVSQEYPITIFQTPAPRPSWLMAMQLEWGQGLSVAVGPEEELSATYVDGWWIRRPLDEERSTTGTPIMERVWDASNVHAVTLVRNNVRIAIFGSRKAGVGQGELIRIAGSLT